MAYIRDMLQVKTLERKLGRELTEEEMNGEKAVRYKVNGVIFYERIKRYPLVVFYSK